MQFENVTVIKAANFYFDGAVNSRTILFADGSKKTLGTMAVGEYEFATDKKEIMEIMSGELDILLPDTTQWQSINAGESFDVPANSKFRIKIKSLVDYCCSYLD